jgi:hypothetical protein
VPWLVMLSVGTPPGRPPVAEMTGALLRTGLQDARHKRKERP